MLIIARLDDNAIIPTPRSWELPLTMKSIGVFMLLCPIFHIAKASANTASIIKNETEKTSWRDYLLPSPTTTTRAEFDESLQARWKQLEEDLVIHKTKFQQHMNELDETIAYYTTKVERDLKKTEKKLKKRIERDVFKQRQGWQRFQKSVRNHIGLVVGGALTFAGGRLTRAAPAIQAAHLSWFTLQKSNVTRSIHDPWLNDAIAGTVALTAVSKLSGTRLGDFTSLTILPLLTIALALGRSVGITCNNYNRDISAVRPTTKTALQVVIAGFGSAFFYISPIPLPLLSVSIAGATILYESFIDEITGNWLYMLERLPPEKQRSLRQEIYHKLQQKVLYPVNNVFVQVRAAIYNETLAMPTLHEKVHDAIYKSFQVRLVWACATAGVMFQLLLYKPLQSIIASAIHHSWWTGGHQKTTMDNRHERFRLKS